MAPDGIEHLIAAASRVQLWPKQMRLSCRSIQFRHLSKSTNICSPCVCLFTSSVQSCVMVNSNALLYGSQLDMRRTKKCPRVQSTAAQSMNLPDVGRALVTIRGGMKNGSQFQIRVVFTVVDLVACDCCTRHSSAGYDLNVARPSVFSIIACQPRKK